MVNIVEKSFIEACNNGSSHAPLLQKCTIFADTRTIDHDKWLKLRRSGIGGSDTSAILGLSKYNTELSLWNDKTETDIPDNEGSESTFWGSTLEPVIRNEYSNRHPDEEVYILPFMLRSNEHPFMIADLDGLIFRNGEWCGLEIKTASEYIKGSWGEDGANEKIPLYYQTQVQHYMAVTGIKKFIFAVLVGGNHYLERVIEANDEVQRRLVEAESGFWDKVVNKIRPELDGSDRSTAYINSRFTGTDAAVLDLSSEEDLIGDYLQAKTALDEAKETVKYAEFTLETYKNRIKEHMGDHTDAVCGEHTITYKMKNNGATVDAKALKTDYPDIYERYAKDKKPSYLLTVV